MKGGRDELEYCGWATVSNSKLFGRQSREVQVGQLNLSAGPYSGEPRFSSGPCLHVHSLKRGVARRCILLRRALYSVRPDTNCSGLIGVCSAINVHPEMVHSEILWNLRFRGKG